MDRQVFPCMATFSGQPEDRLHGQMDKSSPGNPLGITRGQTTCRTERYYTGDPYKNNDTALKELTSLKYMEKNKFTTLGLVVGPISKSRGLFRLNLSTGTCFPLSCTWHCF